MCRQGSNNLPSSANLPYQSKETHFNNLDALNNRKNLTKVSAKAYDYIIKRLEILANIYEYTINNLDIITILYRDFVSEDQLDCTQ